MIIVNGCTSPHGHTHAKFPLLFLTSTLSVLCISGLGITDALCGLMQSHLLRKCTERETIKMDVETMQREAERQLHGNG